MHVNKPKGKQNHSYFEPLQTDLCLIACYSFQISIAIGKSRKLMWINIHDHNHNIKIEGEIFDFGTYYLGGIPIAIRER